MAALPDQAVFFLAVMVLMHSRSDSHTIQVLVPGRPKWFGTHTTRRLLQAKLSPDQVAVCIQGKIKTAFQNKTEDLPDQTVFFLDQTAVLPGPDTFSTSKRADVKRAGASILGQV